MLQFAAPQGRVRGRVFSDLIHTKTGLVIPSANHNIITQAGLGRWDTALFVTPPELVTLCKVGTGLTVPADTDTALTTLLTSKAITELITTNVTGANPYIVARTQYDESEANGDLTEVGLFGATFMFNHAFFGTGTITGATQANPCVITDADHGLTSGQRIRIDSVVGMTQLNFVATNYYYVSVLSSSTFSLYTDATLTTAVNSTGYTAYSSGGVWKIAIPKTASTILVVRVEVELANA